MDSSFFLGTLCIKVLFIDFKYKLLLNIILNTYVSLKKLLKY
jgi:hypothetical protein